eukprot:172772-Rhodomonas_salina.6
MQGEPLGNKELSEGKYIGDGNPGASGGGTYSNVAGGPNSETIKQYEEVFGPAARDIKFDTQRAKRHQRWHLPDALVGPNMFLTDRIDGLITDTTNSPFTTMILPYKYVENPDAKLKWNVWSFDEGMASRVPYESAARVLTQSKRSFAAYTVRQGLAIAMEHNFMKSPAGMENFRNQVKQMVGSIQYTNDLDVHMALIQAPSYARTIAEKYHTSNRTLHQLVRQYVDLFGIVQKNPNAMDLLIEDTKNTMRTWGSPDPTFLLCNGKLTMQLTMTPDKTSYVTQGPDGLKRLKAGPNIGSYRGLNIVKSRAFSIETNTPPRDVLRRRVRVAEYYWIPAQVGNETKRYQFYDEGRDSWITFTHEELCKMSMNTGDVVGRIAAQAGPGLLGQPNGLVTNDNMTNVGLGEWNEKPYNLKIALLSSLGGLNITHGADVLHCDSVFNKQEGGFVQVVQQSAGSTNVNDMLPHVLSSAWIGGGLFNDTTYHLARHNSYANPICNWAGLDARRQTFKNGQPLNVNMFAFQSSTRAQIVTALAADADYSHLQHFVPYCPNRFKFTLDNAHAPENVATDAMQCVTALFAHACLNEHITGKLMAQTGATLDDMCAYHDFLVPFNGEIGFSDEAYNNSVRTTLTNNVNRNAFKTVLMAGMMSHLHPDSSVRSRAATNFANATGHSIEEFDGMLKTFAVSNATVPASHSDAGISLQNACIDHLQTGPVDVTWIDHTSLDANHPLPVGNGCTPGQVQDVDSHGIGTLFWLAVAKRMFCGAERFNQTADYMNPTSLQLSILNRRYAYIKSNGKAVTHSAPFGLGAKLDATHNNSAKSLLIVRPNIEHEMLGVIMGRGGNDELGATLWGQTELSCFDDSQHGIWGMSYKYHERAQVFNERNMVRLWDIAFDGYNGGMGSEYVDFTAGAGSTDPNSYQKFKEDSENNTVPYTGASFIVMAFDGALPDAAPMQLPNPLLWFDNNITNKDATIITDPENIHQVTSASMKIPFLSGVNVDRYNDYKAKLPDFASLEKLCKTAGTASAADETTCNGSLAFQGSMRVCSKDGQMIEEIHGSGHLGHSYVGVAPIREGKGMIINKEAGSYRLV